MIVFIFVSAGLLFSGYLSTIRLFSGTCAFNEPCPYFLGYPACFYGFALYLAMFIMLVLAFSHVVSMRATLKTVLVLTGVGIIFSGSFVAQEGFGLSTCTYGLLFYIAIAIAGLIDFEG